jgi:hypothetical protein
MSALVIGQGWAPADRPNEVMFITDVVGNTVRVLDGVRGRRLAFTCAEFAAAYPLLRVQAVAPEAAQKEVTRAVRQMRRDTDGGIPDDF